MLTLKAMMQMTPADIRARAMQQCQVRIVRSVIDWDNLGEHKKILAEVRAMDGIRYCEMKMYNLKRVHGGNSPTWLHCSCPYFLYYLEVALTARGSSSIITSNGAYPHVRNPTLRPYLCKHLVALTPAAIKASAKPVKPAQVTKQDVSDALRELGQILPKK